MGHNTLTSREMQVERLKIKQIGQQLRNLSMKGAGLSAWEAEELVRITEELFFRDSDLKQILPGQMKYSCVTVSRPTVHGTETSRT